MAVGARFSLRKVWSTDDFQCKRTIRNTLEVQILVVSSKSRYIFCAGDSTNPKRGVVTVWSGSGKREETAVGCRGSDAKPVRLLQGHGNSIRSLYAPDDPGKQAGSTGMILVVVVCKIRLLAIRSCW